MKAILGCYFTIGVMGILYLALVRHGARAQYFPEPAKTFENMTFDMANLGSYNISHCVEELLNCWEIVKPDMLCSWWYYYSSVCSMMKDLCSEYYDDTDNYWYKFYLKESTCWYNWQMSWT